MAAPRSHARQMTASLLVAIAIVALVIVAVTAQLGPTSAAELDAVEERERQRTERLEEQLEAQEDRRENR